MQKNFGKIKNAFNDILSESIVDKNIEKRKIVKRYIKAISESKILKLQFLIYNNIESRIDENEFSANLFITENLNLLKKYSTEEIMRENTKLINSSQMVKTRLDVDYDNKDIHESISKLLFTKPTASSVKELTNNRASLVKYITENKKVELTEESEIPNSFIANIAVDKFNERYSDLTEDEHKVLNVVIESNNEEDRSRVYGELINSCLHSVNNRLKESINKEKLLNVKEKLLSTSFVSETFTADVTKLLDLKRTLDNK